MIRFLFFVVLLFSLGFFIQQGAGDSGEAIIRWHGYEISMSASFLVSSIIVFCILFFFGGQFWAFLVQAPYTFERWRYKRRYEQGFEYFLEGLEALSAGEKNQAKKLASKAQSLLPDSRLSNILSADSAALSGQNLKAIKHYKELSTSDKGQFLGLKGLMQEAKKSKNWEELKNYSEQAYLIKPKSSFVVDNLFESTMQIKDFTTAIKLIPSAQKNSSYTSEILDEYEAFMYIEQAKKQVGKAKIKLLEKALKSQKNCIPALTELVSIYKNNNNIKSALKLINSFFQHTAHISIYELWLNIIKDENNKYYKRRFKTFLKGRSNTFLKYFIQGKEALRLEKYNESLMLFKLAHKLKPCKQVDILLATTANNMDDKEHDLEQALNNLSLSENYIFEGEDILKSYSLWKKEYIEKEIIPKNNKKIGFKLLSKRQYFG